MSDDVLDPFAPALATNPSLALVYNPWDMRRIITGGKEAYPIQPKSCALIPRIVLDSGARLPALLVVLQGDKERDRGLMADADAKVRRLEQGSRTTLSPDEIGLLPPEFGPEDEVSDGRFE